ncbi:hypothetical protein D3C80_2020890 [compost metagenome]
MQDEPVVGIEQVSLGYEFHQPFFYIQHSLARCNTGAVADAENMGVDGHGQLAKCRVEHHVGSLATYAR